MRDKGNSVIVVEHDDEFIRHCDHLIDIGPAAGIFGGEVLLNIPSSSLKKIDEETIKKSRTLSFLHGTEQIGSLNIQGKVRVK